MDSTAISLCMDNKLPLIVFNLKVSRELQTRGHGRADRHRCHGRQALTFCGVSHVKPCRDSPSRHGKRWKPPSSILRRDLAGLRTGRASVALLDGIRVDYYGTMTPLRASGQSFDPGGPASSRFSPGSRSSSRRSKKPSPCRVWASRRRTTEKSFACPFLRSPKNGAKNSARSAKNTAKTRKCDIRGFRRDANEELKKLQKDAKLTEDELRKSEADIQKLTDQYVQKIDDAVKKKEQEILEV